MFGMLECYFTNLVYDMIGWLVLSVGINIVLGIFYFVDTSKMAFKIKGYEELLDNMCNEQKRLRNVSLDDILSD